MANKWGDSKRIVKPTLRVFFLLALFATSLMSTVAQTNDSPGADWQPLPNREEASFSSSRLHALTDLLKTEHTTAMLGAVHGRVLFEYGDVAYVSEIASVRKSVLCMLYGNYVQNGKIDLDIAVFGKGVSPAVVIEDADVPFLGLPPSSE
jgi:CubicO group peptidase (beta-lactamase class C family)